MILFEQIHTAIEFMETHVRDEVSIAQIARQAGMSTWHFQRVFHAFVGETAGSYMRRRRLAESLSELKNSARKIIDIALDYQFGSAEAYSRAFRTEFGFSPREYRGSGIEVVPYRKPALNEWALRYRNSEIEFEPEIRKLHPVHVIGLQTSFVAPLVRSLEYLAEVGAVWDEFLRREHEITARVGAIKVGLGNGIGAQNRHIHDEQMDYLACTPVERADIVPTGMLHAVIPGGDYAVFEATGFHQQTQLIIDYVYSVWLPQSKRRRGEGPSFTWLDHRFKPLDPVTSQVQYFLPLESGR